METVAPGIVQADIFGGSTLVYRTSHNTTSTPKSAEFEGKTTDLSDPFYQKTEKTATTWIPHVSINPKYFAFFDVPSTGRSTRSAAQMEAQKYLAVNDTDGIVSRKATARINRIVTWFTALAKERRSAHEEKVLHYRLTFATLTLCAEQAHDDNFIKRNLLNRFLITLGRKHDVVNYFWRAEAQENGNIHFHIILDKYIHYRELRNEWNAILKDFGYIERYQSKMKEFFKDGFRMSENPEDKRPRAAQFAAYEKNRISDFTDPNSTDIHNLKFVKNIAAYISKYCAKNNRYFEVKTGKIEEVVSRLKRVKECFDVKVKRGAIHFCIKRTTENKLQTPEEFLKLYNIEFDSAREKNIRDINGRLWYASEAVLKMKNFVIEVTNSVSDSIRHIIDNTPGKWIQVSDYCRLFMFDLFNREYDGESVKALFDPLQEHCNNQFATLN